MSRSKSTAKRWIPKREVRYDRQRRTWRFRVGFSSARSCLGSFDLTRLKFACPPEVCSDSAFSGLKNGYEFRWYTHDGDGGFALEGSSIAAVDSKGSGGNCPRGR